MYFMALEDLSPLHCGLGLATPHKHSGIGEKKTPLWVVCISFNPSQLSCQAPDAATVALLNSLGKELVLVEHLHPAKEDAT